MSQYITQYIMNVQMWLPLEWIGCVNKYNDGLQAKHYSQDTWQHAGANITHIY